MTLSKNIRSLRHVKETMTTSRAASMRRGTAAVRKAWPGGKITSNKQEALRKFMEVRMNILEEG